MTFALLMSYRNNMVAAAVAMRNLISCGKEFFTRILPEPISSTAPMTSSPIQNSNKL